MDNTQPPPDRSQEPILSGTSDVPPDTANEQPRAAERTCTDFDATQATVLEQPAIPPDLWLEEAVSESGAVAFVLRLEPEPQSPRDERADR